jgi:hypothetical protein
MRRLFYLSYGIAAFPSLINMKQFLIVIISIIQIISCNFKSGKQDTAGPLQETKDFIAYIAHAISFIKQLDSSNLFLNKAVLVDAPVKIDSFNGLKEIVNDTVEFSKAEIALICKEVNPCFLQKWTQTLLPDKKIIKDDTFRKIFTDAHEGYDYLLKHFNTIATCCFSAPVFLRNYTYCICFWGYSCGMLCGEGKLILYKKIKGQWKEVKCYDGWVS